MKTKINDNVKIIYNDGNIIRSLKGEIVDIDDFFVTIEQENTLKFFEIGKKTINKIELL